MTFSISLQTTMGSIVNSKELIAAFRFGIFPDYCYQLGFLHIDKIRNTCIQTHGKHNGSNRIK